MGLLRAGIGALSGVLEDQWREFFYCDSLSPEVLVAKGRKRQSGNNHGAENIISNGSIIAINEGQAMMIVESGEVVEFSAEPGQFVFDNSTEPSVFYGDLGENLARTFAQVAKRFTFGGSPGKDQRVYFFNTKEILSNKYGTANPVPFRVVDKNIGLDVDIAVRCFGEYSYRIVDPMLFYKNVTGNVTDVFTREEIDAQLKSELLTALQPAFAKISARGVRYSEVPAYASEMADILNEELSAKWGNHRGIRIQGFGISSVSASPEDEAMIKDLQRTAVMRDPSMAAATLVQAQGEAMKAAAANEGGAMIGFAGMNMMQSAGGMTTAGLYQQAATQAQAAPPPAAAAPAPAPVAAPAAAGWGCGCGAVNSGKFCQECGAPRPAPAEWACGCGAVNSGKFCQECGASRPA